MLDPTKNATFEILDALFSELAEMFEGEDSPFVSEMRELDGLAARRVTAISDDLCAPLPWLSR